MALEPLPEDDLNQQLSNGNENFDDEKALEATRAKLQHVRNQR